ncbi:MAG: hypothetical protein Q7S55_01975 [Nanoarchaeota archaeon]|nr:hypothetical protein [Nanoarchaeota archaeon]
MTKIEDKNGLLEVKVRVPSYGGNGSYGFSKDSLREHFEKMGLDDKKIYTFLMTVVNPEVRHYVDSRASEDPDVCNGFTADVSDLYLAALTHLTANRLGKNNYLTYPLIENDGVHNLERHHDQPAWPVIHVIKGAENVGPFRDLVGRLKGDEAYNFIKRREAPQNYRMREVNLVRESNLDPLQFMDREAVLDGATLKTALTVLCQFTYSFRSYGNVIND